MIIVVIIGLCCLVISMCCMKLMDKYNKKWIEIIMGITMIIGFLCVGIASCTMIGGDGGEIRMKPD